MVLASSREQIKNTVKDAADIVQVIGEHVELKRAGNRFTGLCPFHGEKTPSFSVNPQGQFYHCFGCGESGDVFSFVMKYHHMEFPEALSLLAKRFGIELQERELTEEDRLRIKQKELLYKVHELAADFYQQFLLEPRKGRLAQEYLRQRGVPQEAAERYRLGYAPDPKSVGWSLLADHLKSQGIPPDVMELSGLVVKKDKGGQYDRFRDRILFPLTDLTGRVVAFGGRILGDGKPKYLNSPESPIFEKSRLLFGLHQHREAIRQAKRCLVVEGNFDLLLLAVHGIDNVVAPLGTALTRQHLHVLRGYAQEVVLLFDADAAGIKAAMRSVPYFLAEQVEGRVALLPQGHDPDSFVRAEGADAVERLMEQARPLAEFVLEHLVGEYGLTLDGKNRIVNELKPLVQEAVDPGQRTLMIDHFAEKLGVSPGYFAAGSVRVSAPGPQLEPPTPVEERGQTPFINLPRQELQLLDFIILYPEYLPSLQQGGLHNLRLHHATSRLVALLEDVCEQQGWQPEQLLACNLQAEERKYVESLFFREPMQEEQEGGPQQMCDELIVWMQSSVQKRAGHDLKQQILAAERSGNMELLMDLMRQKMAIDAAKNGN